jgi:hypothetical protein
LHAPPHAAVVSAAAHLPIAPPSSMMRHHALPVSVTVISA